MTTQLPLKQLLLVVGLCFCGRTKLLCAQEYQIHHLDTLGGDSSAALGVNDWGQVVGVAEDSNGRQQAFLWAKGTMHPLGFLPGGTTSVATAINNRGDITGYAYVSATTYHAFLYSAGTMKDIGTLGGPNSVGRGINAWGEIAGWAQRTNSADPRAFVWRSNQMIHIPPFSTAFSSEGNGINEHGEVCGINHVFSPNPRWWGYVWADANANEVHDVGEMQLLGSRAPKNSGGEYSAALAINDVGQTVGWTGVTNTFLPHHAMLVTASEGKWKLPSNSNIDPTNLLMVILGTLDGPEQNSQATAINNRGWIVGFSTVSSGTNQAFLWRDGIMANLNDLIESGSGWVMTNATGINENNEIVGSGLYQGQSRGFILRQEGRIANFQSIIMNHDIVVTNDLGDVVTQEVSTITGQTLHWSGIWGSDTNFSPAFTVESCETLPSSNWVPVAPTSQWPTTSTVWTNLDLEGTPIRFFRIRVQPESEEPQ